jgi:hypothetical protein
VNPDVTADEDEPVVEVAEFGVVRHGPCRGHSEFQTMGDESDAAYYVLYGELRMECTKLVV